MRADGSLHGETIPSELSFDLIQHASRPSDALCELLILLLDCVPLAIVLLSLGVVVLRPLLTAATTAPLIAAPLVAAPVPRTAAPFLLPLP